MHNIFEYHHKKMHISDVEKDRIISFWQAQAFFNIDSNNFKNNLSLLLERVTADSLVLAVNHGATHPLYQLVYGGEYLGVHFANAKSSAKNNYSDQVYNNLFMMGWIDKYIEMRIVSHDKITYSIGYQAQHQDLSLWNPDLFLQQELNNQYLNMQPMPLLDYSDPVTLRRLKLERISQNIKLHPFDTYSNLNGGKSDGAAETEKIVANAFKNNTYHTKDGYLAIVESIAKALEGKTKTTKGTHFFGIGFGARTESTVCLYKSILKELEEDILELKQTDTLSFS